MAEDTIIFGISTQQCNICLHDLPIEKPDLHFNCSKCEKLNHTSCLQEYLIALSTDANCPSCQEPIEEDVLLRIFDITWIKEIYNPHRAEVYLAFEKTQLAASQQAAQRAKERYDFELKGFLLIAERSRLRKLWREDKDFIKEELREKIRINKEQIFSHQNAWLKLPRCSDDFEQEEGRFRNIYGEIVTFNPKDCVKCPVPLCRGFLDFNFRCLICRKETCKSCGVSKEEKCGREKIQDHKCEKSDVDSFTLIRKETKGCPKCGIRISRTSGCDHMFCTNCNTCFDWKTLKIQSSNSNPHYWQWFEKQSLKVKDRNGPERLSRRSFLQGFLDERNRDLEFDLTDFFNRLDHISHYNYYQEADLISEIRNNLENYRIDFIIGKISEKEWKDRVFKSVIWNKFKIIMKRLFQEFKEKCLELVKIKMTEEEFYQKNIKPLIKEFNLQIKSFYEIMDWKPRGIIFIYNKGYRPNLNVEYFYIDLHTE